MKVNVVITGAAGQIGYALLFRIASGQMFGPNTQVALRLLEIPAALPALQGVEMELMDGAFPLLDSVIATADTAKAMQDANWVILVGAFPRQAGMERADLLAKNGSIFTSQGKAINDHAAQDVRVLVVGNPCNTNCLIAMHNAPDVPNDRFFAMTTLDELRARSQLAARAGMPVSTVKQMTIWGNHSATQFPDFYHATIHDTPAVSVIGDEEWLKNDFIATVQQRGAAVIKARGSSSAASAANAIITNVQNLLNPTPPGDSFSVCRCSTGEYGIDEGLIFSFPCRVEDDLKVVTGWQHNAFAKAKIAATLEELRQEYQTVKEMGLITC